MAKVKNFFIRAGRWFKNHAPTKRRLIQIYAALLYNANLKGFITGNIYTGNTKYACVPGFNCYSCPGAIGACPLGALQNSLAQTNERAAYYVIGILALFGLIFARTICGFLCPVGLGQELLYKIKTPKLKKSRYTRILSYFKYVLLAVMVVAIPVITHDFPAFCKFICPAGTFGGAGGLLSNPANETSFRSLQFLFSWKFVLLVITVLLSIFIFRFFCRFICPLGAIYGFFNKFALIGVKLDDKKCVDCGRCIQTCKMDIRHVGDHECINCGECIHVCPTKAISWKGSQLIVKGLNAGLTPPEESGKVNLLSIKASETAVAETAAADEKPEAAKAESMAEAVSKTATEAVAVQAKELEIKHYNAKVKRRAFWLQFTAWAVALAVLIGALVYYNVFVKDGYEDVENYYKVGDLFIDPDGEDIVLDRVYKTAGTCDEEGNQIIESLSFQSLLGKVTVFNFWYTECGPCVEELPHFEKVKEDLGDSVNFVVVHSDNGLSKNAVQRFIDSDNMGNKTTSWSDWQMIFTHDNADFKIYESLGGRGGFPMTVIVGADGVVTYHGENVVPEQLLRDKINEAMQR